MAGENEGGQGAAAETAPSGAESSGGAAKNAVQIRQAARDAAVQSATKVAEERGSDEATAPGGEGGGEGEAGRVKPNRAGDPQPYDERGRYAPRSRGEETEGAGEASEGAAPAADQEPGERPPPDDAETTGDSDAGSQEAGATQEGPPEGMVRVHLEEGHPLREDRGEAFIDVPPEMEETVKRLSRGYARSRELDEERRLRQKLEDRLMELETEREFLRERTSETALTAEQQHVYEQLKNTYGEEYAEAIKRGWETEQEEKLSEAVQERRREAMRQRLVKRGEQFRDAMIQLSLRGAENIGPLFPGWDETGVREALASYGASLRYRSQIRGKPIFPDARDFYEFARPMYLSTEAGQRHAKEAMRQIQERESEKATSRAEESARAREEERLKDAANRHASNPNRNLGGVRSVASSGEGEPEPLDKTKFSETQLRRSLRERITQALSG